LGKRFLDKRFLDKRYFVVFYARKNEKAKQGENLKTDKEKT